MSFLYGYQGLIPVAVFTGLGADGLLHRLKPSAARVEALHLTHGVWWSVHLWAEASSSRDSRAGWSAPRGPPPVPQAAGGG
jgi:hypothetical protein